MDWGLLAGGVSKGLNDAFSGANQGLVQGEAIRAGRAGEALQGQHFGLQQQQLGAHLAQQQIQNELARAQLGLHRDQLQQQLAYHSGMLGLHGNELALKQAQAPSEIAKNEAQAGYYNYRPQYLKDSIDVRRDSNDIRNQHYAEMSDAAMARNAIMGKRLEAYIAKAPTMTPFARAQAAQIQSRLRDMRQQFAIASHREEAGLPLAPGMKTIRQLLVEQAALEDEYQQLVGQQPGAPAQKGPAPMTGDAIRQKYGLQ